MNKGHCDICKDVFDVEGRLFFIVCRADQNDTVTICANCLADFIFSDSPWQRAAEIADHLDSLTSDLAEELSEVLP